jgi:VanZ family protein
VGYFTLSLLLFRSWRATFPFPGIGWTIQWARISFFMAALVASLDEWHQTYIPSRTGTFHDVLLDSAAALVAQILLFIILRSRKPAQVYSQTAEN